MKTVYHITASLLGLSIFGAPASAEELRWAMKRGPSILPVSQWKNHERKDRLQRVPGGSVLLRHKRQESVDIWPDGKKGCGPDLPACPGALQCTRRAGYDCSLEVPFGCPGECTAPLNSNGRRACGTSRITLPCEHPFYCKLSNEMNPDLGGECVDRQSAPHWEDSSPKCGRGLPECSRLFQCTQRAGTTCGPESGCPGECTVTRNGKRSCFAMLPTGTTGACPPGFYCKMLHRPPSDEGGECVKGACPNPAMTVC